MWNHWRFILYDDVDSVCFELVFGVYSVCCIVCVFGRVSLIKFDDDDDDE